MHETFSEFSLLLLICDLVGAVFVRLGVATWVGIMVGLIAEVVLSFIKVGIFVLALLI